MERSANLHLPRWHIQSRTPTVFAGGLFVSALLSAVLASWVPLQFSIVTVFLFAGPHNLLEFRYFLMRMPVRLGRSRDFFLVAFGGIFVLTVGYLTMPALYYAQLWSGANWLNMIAVWNTLVVFWLAALIWMRGKQRVGRDWSWAWPLAFALSAVNWLAPDLFSLALVYIHPLIALWFLHRQLRLTHSEWLPTYNRFLLLLPLLVIAMIWQLAQTPTLASDNGLAWRITQHAGAELLPRVSSHMLVSVHVFLEMLHYLVWLLILPVLGGGGVFSLKSIPLMTHSRGFPRLITVAAVMGISLVLLLWVGFAVDYAITRDLYFALAMIHVLAEAPFLLRTIR